MRLSGSGASEAGNIGPAGLQGSPYAMVIVAVVLVLIGLSARVFAARDHYRAAVATVSCHEAAPPRRGKSRSAPVTPQRQKSADEPRDRPHSHRKRISASVPRATHDSRPSGSEQRSAGRPPYLKFGTREWSVGISNTPSVTSEVQVGIVRLTRRR